MRRNAARLLVIVPALLLALASLSAAPQKPTFSTRVEAVRVDVLVTENGQPIRDLRPADFEVRDNGIVQQIDLASFEYIPLNVVLAFDASDSVTGERLEHLRTAGFGLLDGLLPQDRAALITFNHVLSLGSLLTGSLDAVRQALRAITPGGGTALYDATYAGLVLGESDAGRTLLLLFTDGTDTSSYLARETVLNIAQRTEVVVYAVAAGNPTAFEKDIVKQTGGARIRVEATADLPKVFAGILQEFRERYVLSYSPRGVASGGWHQIDVRVKGRRVVVKARAGYQR